MKGVILQKGSFNPLHRMHKRIAEDAKKHFPDYDHYMCLASETCDKGVIPMKELHKRADSIKEAGYSVYIERSGLFIKSIEEARRIWYQENHIVFPVGRDTVLRFFRDWENFYTNDHKGAVDYFNSFQGVTWLVSDRKCSKEIEEWSPVMEKYRSILDNFKFTTLELDDISSSKIRSGEVPNE